jgi:hypothetical protein
MQVLVRVLEVFVQRSVGSGALDGVATACVVDRPEGKKLLGNKESKSILLLYLLTELSQVKSILGVDVSSVQANKVGRACLCKSMRVPSNCSSGKSWSQNRHLHGSI